MAKIQFITEHAASSAFFRASGKSKPDKYLFHRLPNAQHLHVLEIDSADIEEVSRDLALRLHDVDQPVFIKVLIEPTDIAPDEHIDALEKELAELKIAMADVRQERDEALGRVIELTDAAPKLGGLTPEQIAFLGERDAMLKLLVPHAGAEDTPLDVLERLAAPRPSDEAKADPEPTTEEAPPKGRKAKKGK